MSFFGASTKNKIKKTLKLKKNKAGGAPNLKKNQGKGKDKNEGWDGNGGARALLPCVKPAGLFFLEFWF